MRNQYGGRENLSSTKRLQFFAAIFLFMFVLYITVSIFVYVLDQCWTMSSFWLNDEILIQPFWGFCLIFGLLLLWAVIELCLACMGPKDRRLSGIIISSVFTLLLLVLGFGLGTQWQMLQIEQGKMTVDDYWIKTSVLTSRGPIVVDHWDEFVKHKRCADGVDWFALSDADQCKFLREYKDKYPDDQIFDLLECQPIK